MTKKSWNSNLKNAKKWKNDEFYTQLSDIEKELSHYKEHLKDKIVFCNCDDPWYSNFFKYFVLQFKTIWLKKLVTTHYSTDKPSYKIEVTNSNITQILPYIKNWTLFDDTEIFREFWELLTENWDFRNEECIEILKKSDVVVTNPPFSLFREYIAQLIEFNKKFVVVWHQNAISYKEIFKLIKENKIWLWYWFSWWAAHFINKYYEGYASASNHKEWMIRVSWVTWFTNLEIKKRHEDLILFKNYNETEYPKYDNYDAINVDVTKNIPVDYAWSMWVPITFLDKYNPDQFEIIWQMATTKVDEFNHWYPYINWLKKYARVIIKNKKI